jgi:enoyl-[acyl-carrier protein] reductase II
MKNRLTTLLGIDYPIIQGGMIWCSGWRLASAVSNAGGLGLIGAGSMYPDVLREHIRKCQAATDKPFGVNIPLLYPQIDEILQILLEEKIKVVFSSAGNPAKYTPTLKAQGVTVVHVVSSSKFAVKAMEAGCDAVVAEGFEAGGHNGREETTTLCLVPEVVDSVHVPVIAAGGIADGRSMAAALALGAEGVQMGSRFAATMESSAHENFKQRILSTGEGDTHLTLKEIVPVRLIKNEFYSKVQQVYQNGGDVNKLRELLGRGRAKLGMFSGDLMEGELEIGQVASRIKNLPSASDVVVSVMQECHQVISKLQSVG